MAQNDIYSVINAIPIAEDGHIITREYHNSLREALVLIGTQLGVGPISQEVVVAYPPGFIQYGEGPNWLQTAGLAAKDPSGNANGYFVLNFPQGARIQSLTVSGRRVGSIEGVFSVKLLRVTIADGENISLITMVLTNASDPFKVTQTIKAAGAGPAALEEYSIVDNNNYTYLVIAELFGASDLVQVNGIQIKYRFS